MPDLSQTFSSYSSGSSKAYSNGVYTPVASGDAAVSIAGSNPTIHVGEVVTFHFDKKSSLAIYGGYYSDGFNHHPLVLANGNYYLLGEVTEQPYAITEASFTQKTVNCYARGTRILTPRGEIAIEALKAGDAVVTFAGRGTSIKPVRWLGHSRIELRRPLDRETTHPVRIRAGAFSEGCPHRDLVVSPGHHIRLNNELVVALDLVNGASIVQESPAEAEYWHVELDDHDLILADGVQAETYHDIGNRAALENSAVAMLNPVLDGYAPEPCLPYAEVSADMRYRLIARAESLGWTKTFEPSPWVEVDGERIEPVRQDARCRFSIPAGAKAIRLRSRAVRPIDVDAHSTDRRYLGLKLHRLALDGPIGLRVLALTAPELCDGFNLVEQDENGWTWRWTTGNALLDLADLAAGETITALEIDYDQALPMWIEPAMRDTEPTRMGQSRAEARDWALTG